MTLTAKIDAAWQDRYPHDNETLSDAQVKGLPIEKPNGRSQLVMMHGKLCHTLNGKRYRALA